MSVESPQPPGFLTLEAFVGGVFSQGTPSPPPGSHFGSVCVYSKEAWKKWQMKTWVLTQCTWGSSASTRERGQGVLGLLLSGPSRATPAPHKQKELGPDD